MHHLKRRPMKLQITYQILSTTFSLRIRFVSMNQVHCTSYACPCTENSKGVTYFHPLPFYPVASSNLAANALIPLGLAMVALKTACDMVSNLGAYRNGRCVKRCVLLVSHCAKLMGNVCSRIEADSPVLVLPPSDLKLLETYGVNFIFAFQSYLIWVTHSPVSAPLFGIL